MSFVFSPEALETLCGLAETDVPMLSKLHIVQQEHHDQGAPPSVLLRSFPFLHTPTLSDLAFFESQANLLELPIQWTNITTLALTGTRVEGLRPDLMLEILSKCPQIQACHFGLPYTRDNNIPLIINHSVIELTHLRSLQITGWLDGITGILRSLLVPALCEFALNGSMSTFDSTLASHLTAFLARSRRLEDLAINTYIFDDISLLELFRNLPATIRRLYVSNMEAILDADAFATLIPPESLAGDPQVAVPSDDGTRPLTSRLAWRQSPRSNHTLKRVEIELDRTMDRSWTPGLKLHTTYYPTQTAQMFSAWHGLVDEYDPR
ncbi:hypothetical protein B0H16DRAFT_1616488 [Mycena metata]|uniref:F-box domain-containing protein n=1 Tax=Mycena metata TaxID=1033252 RepID=A0AAD7MFU2_9AGAR|nr:hypothetical protein B0H16DRAFT_1616488 [Mycena metata]